MKKLLSILVAVAFAITPGLVLASEDNGNNGGFVQGQVQGTLAGQQQVLYSGHGFSLVGEGQHGGNVQSQTTGYGATGVIDTSRGEATIGYARGATNTQGESYTQTQGALHVGGGFAIQQQGQGQFQLQGQKSWGGKHSNGNNN